MIPGFGKQRIVIGSAPHADIRLSGPGVLPEHAAIVHEGGGRLVFDAGAGPVRAGGSVLRPGTRVPFDFRPEFVVGEAPVPNAHPAIALMLMELGKLAPRPGEVVFGRDPGRVHVVIHHPNVSGHHASFTLNPLAVVDHASTSGTWVDRARLPAETKHPLQPSAVVALGPVPIALDVVLKLAAALAAPALGKSPEAPAAAPAPVAAAAPAEAPGPARKHKTVVG